MDAADLRDFEAVTRVDTLFIRRRGAYASSALEAFLRCARPGRTPDKIDARVPVV